LLATKLLIRVDKILENKKANNKESIIILNKVSNISLIYLISFLFFLIFKIFFDFALFIFFKQQSYYFFVLSFAQSLDAILLF